MLPPISVILPLCGTEVGHSGGYLFLWFFFHTASQQQKKPKEIASPTISKITPGL